MPNGLFRYFSTNEDKLETFTNGQVYLTPPKYFNDPWDFLLRSEPPTEEQVKKEAPFLHPKDVPEFLNQVSGDDSLEEEAREQQEGLSKIIGVVCLTEEPLNRRMWADYGESYKGFVAEFGHSDEGKSQSGFRLCDSPFGAAVKVDYQPTQPVLKRDKSNMEEVVLTKHLDWKYEQEWRVIQPLNAGEPHPKRRGFVLVRFKPTYLLRVVLGLRVCPKVKFQLRQMLNHKEFGHVRTEEAFIDPSSRELKSRPLSW
jgi:hypothetical protein